MNETPTLEAKIEAVRLAAGHNQFTIPLCGWLADICNELVGLRWKYRWHHEEAERLTNENAALSRQLAERQWKNLDQAFITRMDAELSANSHKGDWSDWKPDEAAILNEIWHHMEKLTNALGFQRREEVSEFTADIANFCMKAHERFGALPPGPEGEGEES